MLIFKYKYRKKYPYYKIFSLLNYLKIKEKCRFAAGKKEGAKKMRQSRKEKKEKFKQH